MTWYTGKFLIAQLYCPRCGSELDTAGFFQLYCLGCDMQWHGKNAIEQVNIACAELTAWRVYDFFGEFEL